MLFGRKKKTQTSNDIDNIIAQIERTKKINEEMLTMSMGFVKQTNRRLKEVKK